MIRRFASVLRWDATLQARHHVVTANVVSTLFLVGFVSLVPRGALSPALASALLFADPALVGLSFVGAVVLMEKATRVHLALGVTPLPPSVYLASKVALLTLGGTLSGVAVALAAHAGNGAVVHWPLVVLALAASNLFAVLLGLAVVAPCRSMNELMVRLLYVTLVLFLPLVAHFGLVPAPVAALLVIVPSTPMLWLLEQAFSATLDPKTLVVASAALVVWTIVVYRLALRATTEEVLSDARG